MCIVHCTATHSGKKAIGQYKKSLLSITLFSKEGWDEGRDSGVIDDALRSLVETIRQRAGLLSIAPLVPGGPLEGVQPDLRYSHQYFPCFMDNFQNYVVIIVNINFPPSG